MPEMIRKSCKPVHSSTRVMDKSIAAQGCPSSRLRSARWHAKIIVLNGIHYSIHSPNYVCHTIVKIFFRIELVLNHTNLQRS